MTATPELCDGLSLSRYPSPEDMQPILGRMASEFDDPLIRVRDIGNPYTPRPEASGMRLALVRQSDVLGRHFPTGVSLSGVVSSLFAREPGLLDPMPVTFDDVKTFRTPGDGVAFTLAPINESRWAMLGQRYKMLNLLEDAAMVDHIDPKGWPFAPLDMTTVSGRQLETHTIKAVTRVLRGCLPLTVNFSGIFPSPDPRILSKDLAPSLTDVTKRMASEGFSVARLAKPASYDGLYQTLAGEFGQTPDVELRPPVKPSATIEDNPRVAGVQLWSRRELGYRRPYWRGDMPLGALLDTLEAEVPGLASAIPATFSNVTVQTTSASDKFVILLPDEPTQERLSDEREAIVACMARKLKTPKPNWPDRPIDLTVAYVGHEASARAGDIADRIGSIAQRYAILLNGGRLFSRPSPEAIFRRDHVIISTVGFAQKAKSCTLKAYG